MSLTELDRIVSQLKSQLGSENFSLEEMRSAFEEIATSFPTPEDAQIEAVNMNGVPGEFVKAFTHKSPSTIIYLHGGGYAIGSLKTHRTLAYNLSKASGFQVLLVDYRLAPEHTFPAAIEDSIKAYRWLLQNGWSADRIGIAGDSAGGGLALATCIALREEKERLPSAIVCISPWTDLEVKGESIHTKASVDPICSKLEIDFFRDLYVEKKDFSHPLASPLYADLRGLPPLLIQVGTEEILLDDSIRLAEGAKQCGVETDLKIWDKMIHVWHLFAPSLSEGRDAISQAANFLNKYLVSSL
ncbi:MAG: alpha/beta hydrolase [Prochloraceae cyanobacterium]